MISALGDAREFNKGMTEVATLSPAAKREIDLLGQGVRDVAVLANQELPDATSAMYDMISAGVEVEDAGKALETAGKLAVGGVTTIATSTDLLTTAVNAWGAETVSAERVADIMFATVQKGKTTIDELGGSLFNVAPVAAAAGVSLEEIGAGAATLTAQGAPTSVAMTQMRNAIVELLKPSERLAPVWKAAGYESGEAAIQALGFAGAANLVAEAGNNSAGGVLKLVQSQEAVQAILGITGANLDAFRGNLDATTDSAGAAEGAFEEMSGTLGLPDRPAAGPVRRPQAQRRPGIHRAGPRRPGFGRRDWPVHRRQDRPAARDQGPVRRHSPLRLPARQLAPAHLGDRRPQPRAGRLRARQPGRPGRWLRPQLRPGRPGRQPGPPAGPAGHRRLRGHLRRRSPELNQHRNRDHQPVRGPPAPRRLPGPAGDQPPGPAGMVHGHRLRCRHRQRVNLDRRGLHPGGHRFGHPVVRPTSTRRRS